jgi:hypothetical protein
MNGQLAVCAIRALALEDAIRARDIDRIIWEAQRVISACERALGTRKR